MTSSTLRLLNRQSSDPIPVSGLVEFVAPHFADVVREEWDRSRIASDSLSMEHFRGLMARSTIVHSSSSSTRDMHELSLLSLTGQLPSSDRSNDPEVPEVISEETFLSENKVSFSRRSTLAWLGNPDQSWLRYELGTAKFQIILDAMKTSNNHGHFCEEITTASSTTSSGATGQVAGTMAYRLAICCGRHFGSEQGLRQHVSALHAPPGTWLCRTCGSDCITSQARTHHERSCGQPASGRWTQIYQDASSESRSHFNLIFFRNTGRGRRFGRSNANCRTGSFHERWCWKEERESSWYVAARKWGCGREGSGRFVSRSWVPRCLG
jgi:hypothetical protein